jgi:uncharacterized repeat protein (TIGR01451 family)
MRYPPVIALSVLFAARALFGQSVTFDSPNDLSSNFVINGTTGNFSQVASGGITGGAVDVLTNNASDTAVYKTAVPNSSGQTVSTSLFFRYSRALRDYNNYRFPISLGFAKSTTVSTFASSPYEGLDAAAHIQEYNDGSGQMFFVCSVAATSKNASTTIPDLVDGHWYRFTVDMTNTGDSFSSLVFKVYLQDYGANGQTPAASRVAGSATLTDTSVAQATQLYAGFYAQKDGGTDLLDNFSVMQGATSPQGADVGVTLNADRDPVPVGGTVVYTASITNNGPSDSSEVRITGALPSGENLQNVSCDGSCSSFASNTSFDMDIGAVPAGVTRHVYITVEVDSTGPLIANVSITSTSPQDENSANDTAQFTTTGVAPSTTPMLTTAVQSASITIGSSNKDVATISNGSNPSGTITFTAYNNSSGFNPNAAFTSTVTVSGNGTYSSALFTPASTGNYYFIAKYNGDANNGVVSGHPGDSNESFDVTPAATSTPTPTATSSPTPSLTPTVTPTPPSQLLNLSTRKQVGAGDNVLIGGFIVVGTEDKKVLLRGLGPSLPVAGALGDPTLELHTSDTTLVAFNDNWHDAANASEIAAVLPPSNDLESAILTSLGAKPASQGGAGYTGLLAGKGGTTGIGLLEIYDLNTAANSKLANISTRGFVGVGDDLLIGGFIPGPSGRMPLKILVRALGPSLTAQGVAGALQDPVLELHDANGTLVVNDNWQDASNASEIQATLPPPDARESAIIITLAPSNAGYTAVVRGANSSTGVALVEIYALQ